MFYKVTTYFLIAFAVLQSVVTGMVIRQVKINSTTAYYLDEFKVEQRLSNRQCDIQQLELRDMYVDLLTTIGEMQK